MKGNPEEKNERTRRITELCAQNHLLCDFHDGPVHPYGQLRTWPNAVTREFCHAQLDAHRVFEPKTFVTIIRANDFRGAFRNLEGGFDVYVLPEKRPGRNAGSGPGVVLVRR